MKTKSKSTFLNAVALTTLIAGGVLAQQVVHPKKSMMEVFMRQKLEYSQKVLEGITLEKYDLVVSNGARMSLMTRSNTWVTLAVPDYQTKTEQFRGDVLDMVDAARASNTVMVLKAYARVTADCVDCHQACRTEQHARPR